MQDSDVGSEVGRLHGAYWYVEEEISEVRYYSMKKSFKHELIIESDAIVISA